MVVRPPEDCGLTILAWVVEKMCNHNLFDMNRTQICVVSFIVKTRN